MVVAARPRIDVERFHEDGYLAVEGVLDIERDLVPVVREYEDLLDREIATAHAAGKIPSTYPDLPFVQRLAAYLTDAGMTGPHDSIIGMEREPSLARFLTGLPSKFEPATGNPRLNGVVLEADDKTGRATKITRINYSQQDLVDHRFEYSDRAAPLSRPV